MNAKYIIGIILVATVALAGLVTMGYVLGHQSTAPSTRAGSGFALDMVDTNGNTGATSTNRAFLGAGLNGATTTLSTSVASVESIDLNMLAEGSTSAAVILWTEQFSNNNTDWYCEDGNTLNSTTLETHGAGCITHSWTPGTTATSSKNFTIKPVASQFMRVNFSAVTASSSLYAQLIKKKIIVGGN